MILLACRDRASYAAAIIDRAAIETRLGGKRFAPVLGAGAVSSYDDEPLHESIASLNVASLNVHALFDRCAETLITISAKTSSLTAYVSDDESARLFAAAFAAFSNRPLIPLDHQLGSEPTAAAAGSVTVTVVVSSETISKRGTDWIRHRVRALFPKALFGILTASDEVALSAFIARVLSRTPSPRGVAEVDYAPDARPYGLNEDGTSFLPGDLRTMAPIGKKVDGKVLFFRGHSREYCGQRGRLCSRSLVSEEEKLTCVAGLECVADEWARSPTRDVRSDIVFLDICSAGKFPGSLEPSRNLTTQLIDGGASAVVTSAGRYYVDELTPLLTMRLMASGLFKLGNIAEAINSVQRQRYGAIDCVLLFGDPESTPFSDRTPLPEIELSAIATSPSDETISIKLPEPIGSNVEILLLRNEAASLVAEAPYTSHSSQAEQLPPQAILLRLDEHHAAAIVIGAQGRTDDLVFGRQPPVDLSVYAAAADLVGRITLLPTASREDDPLLVANAGALGDTIVQTRAIAHAAARLGSKSMAETAQLRASQTNIDDAAQKLAVQHARACTKAITWGGWLESYYIDRGQMDMLSEALLEENSCPTCHSMPLLACRYRVFGAGRTDDRERLECERCGVVCDVIIGTPPLWIDAPIEVHLGDHFEARVHGKNATELPMYLGVDAIVAYVDPAKCELKVVDSQQREGGHTRRSIGPGQSFTITLKCRVDPEVRAHAYDLRAILSMNGAVALANRRVLYRRRRRPGSAQP